MPLERTLSIVKPDGVARNLIGEVYRRFEKAGLSVIAARMTQLTERDARRSTRCTGAAVLCGSGALHDLRTRHGPGAGG